ncbi:plasmid partitioning protein RepB (plasmid) [Ochrobactrum quorumnocens]|uniref:Plasmid partitioning protein RepB n=1 Tax=Ochrobactrum quorumnocens TaxID=271865 RepID=A0A248UPX7_9HYPH|nr:plasmid partitioning protein RepB [[Ochrobactrum] quorumnocens]ASV88785.1 plasmid partitioning protein RepB [[Ochrobactrum] quorumnocens]
MSRKNPFANLDLASLNSDKPAPKSGYGMTGPAKTVVRSIEEMAENTKRLMEGETIVEIEPHLLDVSFASDRLSEDDIEFEALKEAIKDHGQATPILVRPNPHNDERYMVVFGHRRARAAMDLGIRVKAVVKKLDDISSAIAQGQENSARSNLSFIERAYFAQNLLSSGMSKDIVKSAIGIDDALLSKMLSVVETVPSTMIMAMGASKKIGRDKWLSLRQIILNPAHLDVALSRIASDGFMALPEEERFDALHEYLKKYSVRSAAKVSAKAAIEKSWLSEDRAVRLSMKQKPKNVAIELSSTEARPFSDWLSSNMDRFYIEYKQTKSQSSGD